MYNVKENEGLLEVCIVLTGTFERSIGVYMCSENETATGIANSVLGCQIKELYAMYST